MNKKQILIFTSCYTLCALVFPPFNLGWMVFFLWAPIFYLTEKLSAKQAFFYHAILSVPYNIIMYYWMYNVLNFIPNNSLLFGLLLLIVFFCLLSGWIGVMFVWARRLRFFPILFPILWVGFEVFRTQGELSFPWFHLGYSLGNYLPLIQVSSIIGVFGISFLLILSNMLLLQAYKKGFFKKIALPYIIGSLMIPLLLFVYGFFSLLNSSNQKGNKEVTIHIVQPAIPQDLKWERSLFYKQMNSMFMLMKETPFKAGDLFVLPETAVSHFLQDVPTLMNRWLSWVKENQVGLIVGALDVQKNDHPVKRFNYFNAAFFFRPDLLNTKSLFDFKYSKIRLVPFSEKLPFDDIFPFLDFINLGEGDFVKGKGFVIWNWQGINYSPAICYEVVYPYFIRGIKNKGADILLNLTNDSWFGSTSAPYQHANITRFRAVELGLPIIRSVNGGFSVYYDSWGRIISQTNLAEITVLTNRVTVISRTTLYQKIGSVFEYSFLLFWIAFHLWVFFHYLKNRKK